MNDESRVLIRRGARELDREETKQVSGGVRHPYGMHMGPGLRR